MELAGQGFGEVVRAVRLVGRRHPRDHLLAEPDVGGRVASDRVAAAVDHRGLRGVVDDYLKAMGTGL